MLVVIVFFILLVFCVFGFIYSCRTAFEKPQASPHRTASPRRTVSSHRREISWDACVFCPSCDRKINVVGEADKATIVCRTCGNSFTLPKFRERTAKQNSSRIEYIRKCHREGIDVVMVTVSGSPCPKCAVWENRLLSITGATKGLPLLQSALDSGLFHANCTHSTVAVADYDVEHNFSADGRPLRGYNSVE